MTATIHDTWPLSQTALKPALTLAMAIEHAPMGVLMLRNEASGALELLVAEGMTDEQSSRFGFQHTDGPFGVAYSEHRRVFVRDVLVEGDGIAPILRELGLGVGFRCLDVVPLVLENGTVIGAFAALFPRERRLSARSVRLVEMCSRLVALVLDNARLRADAERRREIVEALARARVQFVARLSHELRTPLQSITGYVDLLRLGRPDSLTEEQHRMLDRVVESEQVLINVIDDLGSMARLEAGRLDYEITNIDASHAMFAARDVVQPLANQKGIRVQAGPTDVAFVAKADDSKVKQILINLLANAVKFTPSGGAVGVTCRAEQNAIVFEVADTGSGIPADKLEDVFEPFVQLGSPLSGLAGSGLGLAISLEFARGMGGSLTVSSTPGKGSVFTLRLPRGQDR